MPFHSTKTGHHCPGAIPLKISEAEVDNTAYGAKCTAEKRIRVVSSMPVRLSAAVTLLMPESSAVVMPPAV